jgi:predicted PurR-regulated permease PerM
MDAGYLFLMALTYAFLLIVLQRTDARHRRLVRYIVWLIGGLVLIISTARLTETLLGLVIGAALAVLFWLLIGRYNKVGSSDEIKVLGLDD